MGISCRGWGMRGIGCMGRGEGRGLYPRVKLTKLTGSGVKGLAGMAEPARPAGARGPGRSHESLARKRRAFQARERRGAGRGGPGAWRGERPLGCALSHEWHEWHTEMRAAPGAWERHRAGSRQRRFEAAPPEGVRRNPICIQQTAAEFSRAPSAGSGELLAFNRSHVRFDPKRTCATKTANKFRLALVELEGVPSVSAGLKAWRTTGGVLT
jgi:hypothetical protein